MINTFIDNNNEKLSFISWLTILHGQFFFFENHFFPFINNKWVQKERIWYWNNRKHVWICYTAVDIENIFRVNISWGHSLFESSYTLNPSLSFSRSCTKSCKGSIYISFHFQLICIEISFDNIFGSWRKYSIFIYQFVLMFIIIDSMKFSFE